MGSADRIVRTLIAIVAIYLYFSSLWIACGMVGIKTRYKKTGTIPL